MPPLLRPSLPHGRPAPSCSPDDRRARRLDASEAAGGVRRQRRHASCRGRRAVLETAGATSVASRGIGSAPTALLPPPAAPSVPRTVARVERGRESPRMLTVAGDVAQKVTFCWRCEPAEGTTEVRAGLRRRPGRQKRQSVSRRRASASASDARPVGRRQRRCQTHNKAKKHNNQPYVADMNLTELRNCGGFDLTMGKMARGGPMRNAAGWGANI